MEEYAAGKGQYPPPKRRRKQTVYVATIEKALGLTNSLIETQRLEELGLFVVDELHLVGDSSGRGSTLEGLLTKVMYMQGGHEQGMHFRLVFCVTCCALQFQKYIGSVILSAITHTQILEV